MHHRSRQDHRPGVPSELKNTLGQDLIYLETSDNAAASAMLPDVPGVRAVEQKQPGLLVLIREDGTRFLPTLIEMLRQRGSGLSRST